LDIELLMCLTAYSHDGEFLLLQVFSKKTKPRDAVKEKEALSGRSAMD